MDKKPLVLKSHREEINRWLKKGNRAMKKSLREIFPNSIWDIKAGDTIVFKNGYGILMQTVVVGFEIGEGGCIYLDWDCYWYPIKEDRIIRVLTDK